MNKKIIDLKIARKKKKQKNMIKRIKLIVFLLIVSLIFLAICYLFNLLFFKRNVQTRFPIVISEERINRIHKLETGFLAMTGNKVNIFSKNGEIKRTIEHFGKTSINSAGDCFVLFERGGKSFSSENFKKTMFNKIIGRKILKCSINSDGKVAVAVQGENCICDLLVFNENGKLIFKWCAEENLIMDLKFIENGKKIVVATIQSDEGEEQCGVHLFDHSKKKKIFSKLVTGIAPIAISSFGSVIEVVCEGKILFLDHGGNVLKLIEDIGEIKKFVFLSNGLIVLVVKDFVNCCDQLIIQDRIGGIVAKKKCFGDVKKIVENGKNFVMILENSIVLMDHNLKILKQIKNFIGLEFLICFGKIGLGVVSSRIVELKLN